MDITEEKELNNRLQRAIGNVESHLATVKGWIEVYRYDEAKKKSYYLVESILEVQDMLIEVSKIEETRKQYEKC
ncbi:MAG: hypothetical protein JXR50_06355 [Prolixibacteraceae bacterium]|nr:hypothetical protein [Prolixibacteraceae bacterium]